MAHIVLLPKEENAVQPSSFRPISILNYIPKLISKVLASRLTTYLPSLISPSHTGFVKGRLISENFNAARELISHVSKNKDQTILLKLDFHKAFDSVCWRFLLATLHQRGFPTRFISWIRTILSTATSSISVNGKIGPSFQHKRGLRQGDPISPALFILASDVLARMAQAVSLTVPHSISSKISDPFVILQYADDTLFFSTAKGNALTSLKIVLNAFSMVSGIKVNRSKTSFVPFNLNQQQQNHVQQLFQCTCASLPMKYLGLPLTSKRPDRVAFQTLIDKINNKLAGWKTKLLSRAGRVILASSVLSTIPIFFMSVFRLPKWVIRAIDKARRNFIWRGKDLNRPGVHLISWDRVCLPKKYGGFGLLNLNLQNIALLLRWIWRLYSQQNTLWSAVSCSLYGKMDRNIPPMAWSLRGSFFWKDLMALRFYFQLSTKTEVHSGMNSLFWFDNWCGTVLKYVGFTQQPPPKRFISLKRGLQLWNQLIPFPMNRSENDVFQLARQLHLTDGRDEVLWKWTSSTQYSSASIYTLLATAGKVRFHFQELWRLRLPLSIKLFLILLIQDRILTQNQLLKRKINFVPGCALCQQNLIEEPQHLFLQCTFASNLWHSLALSINPADDLYQMFNKICSSATQLRTKTLIATTLWAIWMERNNRIFRNERRAMLAVHDWIVAEATLFMKFC